MNRLKVKVVFNYFAKLEIQLWANQVAICGVYKKSTHENLFLTLIVFITQFVSLSRKFTSYFLLIYCYVTNFTSESRIYCKYLAPSNVVSISAVHL